MRGALAMQARMARARSEAWCKPSDGETLEAAPGHMLIACAVAVAASLQCSDDQNRSHFCKALSALP